MYRVPNHVHCAGCFIVRRVVIIPLYCAGCWTITGYLIMYILQGIGLCTLAGHRIVYIGRVLEHVSCTGCWVTYHLRYSNRFRGLSYRTNGRAEVLDNCDSLCIFSTAYIVLCPSLPKCMHKVAQRRPIFFKRKRIPVGCVPSAAVAVPARPLPHPTVDRMTDTCKIITLPQLLYGR